jgi:hypothetical protein
MIDWIHQLGKHLLKEGALTYIVSDENPISWDGIEETKQKIDMVAFYPDYVSMIELKETEAEHRKGIKFKQIERYSFLCQHIIYDTQFWIYVYWHKYNLITGVLMNSVENLQFYAIDHEGETKFFASIGSDPATRIRKDVDFILRFDDV